MSLTYMTVFLYVFINNNVFGQLAEHAICQLDSGKFGYCLPVYRCPAAIDLIKKNGHPKICDFQGQHPIVCCENTPQPEPSKLDGFLSRKKCIYYKLTSMSTTVPGSQPQEPQKFPHMAILGYGSRNNIQWKCVGSLISEHFILTAAHCIQTKDGKVAFIKFDGHQLNKSSVNSLVYTAKNTYLYSDYLPSQSYHDIALVELDRQVNIDFDVRPACLHTEKDLPQNVPSVAVSVGATKNHGKSHDTWQNVNVSYVPSTFCARYYTNHERLNKGFVDAWQLCVDSPDKNNDICQDNSGGPLQILQEGEKLYTIIGIKSFDIKCGITPAIYTRVSNYVPWIENIVWKR